MTPQEHIKELRNALRALHDEQNGAPLIRREKFWQAAMAEAERLLAMEPVVENPDDCGIFTGYCAYDEKNYLPK